MSNPILKEIKIEVTYACPLACVHCSSDANSSNSLSMDKNKCLEIIAQAKKMKIEKIAFSGGEPLLWEGLFEAVQLSSKSGINTTIYTSGNIENKAEVLKKLSTSGLNKIIFSLYSDKEDEHNIITRKQNSYSHTIDAINLMSKIKNIDIEIHFVALAENYHKLKDIAELSQSFGIKQISVLRFVPQGRGSLISKQSVLSKQQNIELKNSVTALRKQGFNIRTGSPFNVLLLNEVSKCMAAIDRLTISPDCRIYPCDAFKQLQVEYLFGKTEYSILEGDITLQECWDKSIYLNEVRKLTSSSPGKPCNECKKYKECGSGCLAQKYLYHSNFITNPDPACIITI